MPKTLRSEKPGTGNYYVTVDGSRWSPVCRLNEATRYFQRAQKIYEISRGVHTVQLIHIMDEVMVGLG